MSNFFPGINEEDKYTLLLKSYSFFNLFWFLFITSIISLTIDSFLNFISLIDILRVWIYIILISISRFLFIDSIIKIYKDINIDIVLNKI
ncbi:MAG TPA: hypothetical protein QF889_01505, partial [Flavobacteriaceae bacterium]|nr:hypothetical protein [Flavobacteriaceae bacterium]